MDPYNVLTRLAPWAVLSKIPRTPHSTAPWTIFPFCATNSRTSADVPTPNLDRVIPANQVSNKPKTAGLDNGTCKAASAPATSSREVKPAGASRGPGAIALPVCGAACR